ncbi:hypothetical protein [Paenibacillus sp. NAIST15-1]|uniref:hypothetical protein n=1 Tax=Paenibacillus sp. NAIST15-1 TaxID=1605994 RepID=UPI00086D702B|nr:hypothetical protein [Paenibacillus sp. NAIST15-1]GAV11287.1 putative phage structural protein [Paenibacillus sp. NAIST15-1]
MTTPNRWAIRDAGIVTFYSLTSKKPVVTLRTLKTSGLETTGETVYAQGGFGNPRLVGFSSNRQSKVTLQDAIFDNKALAMLTGNDLIEGATSVSRTESPLILKGGKITLKATPVGTPYVYKILSDGTLGEEVAGGTVKDKEITFTGLTDGDELAVYYNVTTDASAKTLKVTSDAFGKTFKVVMDCLVRDADTKKDYAAQITIPNAKFEDNFNLNMAVDGDPAVLDLNLEVLKDPRNTDMWLMTIYDEEAIK